MPVVEKTDEWRKHSAIVHICPVVGWQPAFTRKVSVGFTIIKCSTEGK